VRLRPSRSLLAFLAALCLGAGASPAWPAPADPVTREIRQRIAALAAVGARPVGRGEPASSVVLPDFYRRRGFRPAWGDLRAVDQMMAAIRESAADGLTPADYHLEALENLAPPRAGEAPEAPARRAARDLLLTDALLRLAFHLHSGKVNPSEQHPGWDLREPFLAGQVVEIAQGQVEALTIGRFLEFLRPTHPLYASLRSALARYRAIADAGAWQPIAHGPVLEKGARDERVAELRQRLLMTGDLEETGQDPTYFDAALEEAVTRFQDRHYLDVYGYGINDWYGAVGEATLEKLNQPIDYWIGTIRANLERGRWVLRDLEKAFVIADVAGFEVHLVEHDRSVWWARAQVGDSYRETPVFRSTIQSIEFNPTWTVPEGILERDILPAIKRNPVEALATRQLEVFDRQGRRVDPRGVDWRRYTARNLPFRLVRAPGPDNPLGLVKFLFPNPFAVYIHDTPDKQGFEEDKRASSAGCIRLERPFELAERLLVPQGDWSQDNILKVIDAGKTRRLTLARPMPVILYYWTVRMDDRGGIFFRDDIYQRDARLLEALDGPVVLWHPLRS
jgi:murein L,D-transpeptidase YcbB/YkuD